MQPESVLPPSAPRTEDPTLRALRQWVANRLGLRFDYQRSDFRARIEAFCRAVHHKPDELLEKLLAEDPEMVARVAEIISTNHTSFYREPEAFVVFQETVLPSLPVGPLRIWSAAASSGEEAYTIAFCVRDALGVDAASRVRILGTDRSDRQIKLAERGLYPRFLLPADPQLLARFIQQGEDYEVPEAVRAMCLFRRMNLVQMPWPLSKRFHVVFLRNGLYYFKPTLQQRILEACYDAVEPGGWLFTSLTEPLLDVETRFCRVAPGLFQRLRE